MTNSLTFILSEIRSGESETVEFKSSFDKETIETLVAFANTKGGKVFVGVSDSGEVRGIQVGRETVQSWINQVKLNTSTSIVPDVEVYEIEGKTVVVLDVSEYPIKPVAFKGRYFKRVKNANHQLSTTEVVNLHLQSCNTSWDSSLDDQHTETDISLDKVQNFVDMANKVRVIPIADDPLVVMQKYELLREGRITRAAFLLFMAGESSLTTVELGRFQTETDIKDGARLKTDLFSEVDGIMAFIRKHINRAYIITGKPQRDERWDYPLDALREIVLNAVIHRDYASSSDSIVKIFDERIEIYNPGKLPTFLTIEKLLAGEYRSSIRNRRIADMFKEAGLVEKYGSGIRRILEGFAEYGLPAPRFQEISDGFMVTVCRADTATQKTTQKTTQKLLDLLVENPHLSKRELAELLAISEDGVKYQLLKLKKSGRIRRIGPDKGGYWEVLT